MGEYNLYQVEIECRERFTDIDIKAYPQIDSAVCAMKEGACDYVTKPFHMDDIQLKVQRALHSKKRLATLKKSKILFMSLILLMPIAVSGGIILGMFWKAI